MADILYIYGDKVYANLTNRCNLECEFCIRKNGDGVGSANCLWHTQPPTFEKVKDAIDNFNWENYRDLVFCGYGEPTCALNVLLATAQYMKQHHSNIKLRLDTNGTSDLYNGQPTAKKLSQWIDTVSISLNAPNKEAYDKLCHPELPGSWEAMLRFAKESKDCFSGVMFTLVDVIPPQPIQQCQQLADQMGIPLRIREYVAE